MNERYKIMCDVIDFKTGDQIEKTMTVKEAEAIVGEGQMTDELISTRELCSDDPQIVEACDVLIAVRS